MAVSLVGTASVATLATHLQLPCMSAHTMVCLEEGLEEPTPVTINPDTAFAWNHYLLLPTKDRVDPICAIVATPTRSLQRV